MIQHIDIVGGIHTSKTEIALAYAVGASRFGSVLFVSPSPLLAGLLADRAREVAGVTGWLEPVRFVGVAEIGATTMLARTIICDAPEHFTPGQHHAVRTYVDRCVRALRTVWLVNAVDRLFYEAACDATRPKAHPSIAA